MVTTQAGSSASPLDRASSPAVPPDRAGSPIAPQDRAVSPPGMIGIISTSILTESGIFVHVLTNILRQPSNGPLA